MQAERQSGPGPLGTEHFPRSCRLRRRSEFRRLQADNRRVHTRHFLLLVSPARDGAGRLGITVTKKVANAPGRNRIKRVVREVYRRNRTAFPPNNDVVVIAKRGAGHVGYAEALGEVTSARRALQHAAGAADEGRE